MQFTGKKWDQKEYQDYSHYAGGQKITPAKEMLATKPEEIIRRAVKRMVPRPASAGQQMAKLKIYAGNAAPAPGPAAEGTQTLLSQCCPHAPREDA